MTKVGITQRAYGRMPDGREVTEYVLDNGRGMRLAAINHGGIVTSLEVPDREGQSGNVVLGLPTLADYVEHNPNFGTIVGRYANRIAGGRFMLDGAPQQVSVNDGPNSLHGGHQGFGKRWWDIVPVPDTGEAGEGGEGEVALELRYTSADGEEGYPGAMQATVRYVLNTDNEWRIDYEARCDRPTVVNLSHHDYFNLAGSGSVLDHELMIAASRYTPVDATLIPTGIAGVEGTPFDFRVPTRIGARIRNAHEQLQRARGYDHNWVLDRGDDSLALAVRLSHAASGRVLEVHTTQPGVQFYSGNFLDATLVGAAGQAWRQGDGLCLETQHFPDSPNHAQFPSTVLRPGEVFRSSTLHRFRIDSAQDRQR